jgi:hypothetical protein
MFTDMIPAVPLDVRRNGKYARRQLTHTTLYASGVINIQEVAQKDRNREGG